MKKLIQAIKNLFKGTESLSFKQIDYLLHKLDLAFNKFDEADKRDALRAKQREEREETMAIFDKMQANLNELIKTQYNMELNNEISELISQKIIDELNKHEAVSDEDVKIKETARLLAKSFGVSEEYAAKLVDSAHNVWKSMDGCGHNADPLNPNKLCIRCRESRKEKIKEEGLKLL